MVSVYKAACMFWSTFHTLNFLGIFFAAEFYIGKWMPALELTDERRGWITDTGGWGLLAAALLCSLGQIRHAGHQRLVLCCLVLGYVARLAIVHLKVMAAGDPFAASKDKINLIVGGQALTFAACLFAVKKEEKVEIQDSKMYKMVLLGWAFCKFFNALFIVMNTEAAFDNLFPGQTLNSERKAFFCNIAQWMVIVGTYLFALAFSRDPEHQRKTLCTLISAFLVVFGVFHTTIVPANPVLASAKMTISGVLLGQVVCLGACFPFIKKQDKTKKR